ncbi:MAG: hypothetical protein UE295_00460, partial [Acutalibacteraceae bacterium]|nr:hypothetical protein [Acutalibacteraceae bacterium]
MARLPRVTQKIFAKDSPTNQVTTFGSIKAGTPVYSKQASDIMNANFEGGWSDAVEDDYAPYRQDRNAVDTAITQQLGYLYQDGVAEWDAGTTYYKGSICKVISGNAVVVYKSIADSNTSSVNDITKWQKLIESDANGKIVSPTISTPTIEGGSMSSGTFSNPTFSGTVNVPLASQSSSTDSTIAASIGWANNPTLSSNIVHRTGNESISGAKTFSSGIITTFNGLNFSAVISGVTKGTSPSANAQTSLGLFDKNGISSWANTLGRVNFLYNTAGNVVSSLTAFKPELNSTTYASISVTYPASGEAYTEAPTPSATNSTSETKIATTGWVNDPNKSTNVVHRSGNENINDNKTFNGQIYINNQAGLTFNVSGIRYGFLRPTESSGTSQM